MGLRTSDLRGAGLHVDPLISDAALNDEPACGITAADVAVLDAGDDFVSFVTLCDLVVRNTIAPDGRLVAV